ncbi:MAG TPA: hypothetical protein VFR17_09505 [Mycobacterium sp.]|nr:hypothetical protein [Mycobacterium sp.]
MRRSGGAAAALLVAVLAAGCVRTTPGAAVSPAQPPIAVDVGKLDPGPYPTAPSPPLGVAGSDQVGRLAEGRRMADYVVGPWQVDPALIGGGSSEVHIVTDRMQLGTLLWPAITAPAYNQPFLVAFSSQRDAAADDATSLRNIVLRFAGEQAAATTARGISAAAMTMPVMLNSGSPIPAEPIRAVPIPGHPGVSGALLTHLDGDRSVQELTAASARGPFVLVQVARSAGGPDGAAALAGRALDLQAPLIDRFQPTDPARFADIALDPTGLVARTLQQPRGSGLLDGAAYAPAGALHLAADPVRTAAAFSDAGVDAVSVGLTRVYQAANADQARALAAALAAEAADHTAAAEQAGVPGLPGSRCIGDNGLVAHTWCVAVAGRQVITALTQQPVTAHQQVAAQYRMLLD